MTRPAGSASSRRSIRNTASSTPAVVHHDCSGDSTVDGSNGTLKVGTAGMPLKPPSSALPILYASPEVELTELNRISVTVSVMTPR